MLSDKTISLATGPNFAVLTTLMPDGQPQSHVMWVGYDGEGLTINTEIHRRKMKNIEADPRVTVVVIDKEDPYSFAEVRGRVTEVVRGAAARQDIDDLSEKYLGKKYPNDIQSERVILRITAEREIVH